jgi:sarcosine oxidase / L-pipecolate oxidase
MLPVCRDILTPVRDAVSPNQDWIIDYHPHCKNLLVTGAGSFHAWKFLPNIGKYVTQRLLGELAQEKAAKWAWDRPDDGAACEMYIPSRDLKTIGPFKGWPRTGV